MTTNFGRPVKLLFSVLVVGCFIPWVARSFYVEFQTSLTSHATLNDKDSYEQHCCDIGVISQKHLSDDDSAFTNHGYWNRLSEFNQIQQFAITDAHHLNSWAERFIQTITSISQAVFMHSVHWSDMEYTSLWPMAVSHVVYLSCHIPNHTAGLRPSDFFTRKWFKQSKLLGLHFGFPVYLLEKSSADGEMLT